MPIRQDMVQIIIDEALTGSQREFFSVVTSKTDSGPLPHNKRYRNPLLLSRLIAICIIDVDLYLTAME